MKPPTFAVLAGTTRAGSTALFAALAAHPQVCPARIKETGFFLDPDYPNPTPSPFRLHDGLEKYLAYFQPMAGQTVYWEATPGYLYSPGTAQRIRQTLEGVRLIFVLRNPLERLASAYRFAVQIGRIDAGQTFAQYIERQCQGEKNDRIRDLQTGRYAAYLESYLKIFPRRRIRVLPFSELVHCPEHTLAEICRWLEIRPDFYRGYTFPRLNASHLPAAPGLHRALLRLPAGRNFPGVRRLAALYWRLQAGKENFEMTDDTRDFLQSYYADELDAVREVLAEPDFNW